MDVDDKIVTITKKATALSTFSASTEKMYTSSNGTVL